MDDLHTKGELYLGYASFAYYVKTEYGYELELNKNGDWVYLTGDGICFPFQLTLYCDHVECGYVYTNSYDWGHLFAANIDMARYLSEKCKRRKGALRLGDKDWHCHIDDLMRKQTRTEIDNRLIKCVHPCQP